MSNPFGNGNGGTTASGGTAEMGQRTDQKQAAGETQINPASVPAGGKDAKCDPGQAGRKDAGTGSLGNSKKPFKLGK